VENWLPSDEEKKVLFKIARNTISSKLNHTEFTYPKNIPETLKPLSGAFVTLKMDGELRGCIGYTQAIKPLDETIHEMANAAAFEDPRFGPVNKSEYDFLEIEISIITPMVLISDVDEIEVGKHGLMIKKGFMSGLLLPQVATEYNWNREEFLQHTCNKAGLAADAYNSPDAEIYKFSAIIINE